MMSETPEERAITRTKEFFAPHISHWPDKRVKGLKTYRQFLLQECWADFRNAVYEDLRIPRFVRWLQKRIGKRDRVEEGRVIND